MKFESVKNKWQQFLDDSPDNSISAIAQEASSLFMDKEVNRENPDLQSIDLLCEMALFKDNIHVRQAAVTAIYKNIVEKLCDDFSSESVVKCNLVLLRMIEFFRKHKEGASLNALLNNLQFPDQNALLKRYNALQQQPYLPGVKNSIEKCLILSRVTVGADIAITSIIVQRLCLSFPKAEIVIFGPTHLPEIFHNLPRVRCIEFHYQRNGGLAGRLAIGTTLYHRLEKEKTGLKPGQVLLFDPDSRLSQLGLLPLHDADHYCFFCSRTDQQEKDMRLSLITNRWLNELLRENQNILPQVSIRAEHLEKVKQFFQQFHDCGKKVVINLGVGNDPKKRLPDPFEESLLSSLLESNTLVILDSGSHPGERERARMLMEKMKSKGINTVALSENNLTSKKIPFQSGLVCMQGGIGVLTALIDQADIFFGYDSCCQHIATARETPSVICFAGAANERFFERWRPLDASGSTQTVRIEDSSSLSLSKLEELADKFCRLLTGN